MKSLGILFGTVLILGIASIAFYFNVSNKEIRIRNRYAKQENVIESYYDKMFKILQQKAGVTTEYKESFKEVYVPLMEGRKGGTLMKWIQESNPNFDPSLYQDLMNSIEAERNGFFVEQQKIMDIELMHDNLLQVAPTAWIVGDREPIDYVPITSAKAKEVRETREENDIDLFKKD